MRISSLIKIVEDKAIRAAAAAKPRVSDAAVSTKQFASKQVFAARVALRAYSDATKTNVL